MAAVSFFASLAEFLSRFSDIFLTFGGLAYQVSWPRTFLSCCHVVYSVTVLYTFDGVVYFSVLCIERFKFVI